MTLLKDKLPEMSSLVTAEVEGRQGDTGTDLRDLAHSLTITVKAHLKLADVGLESVLTTHTLRSLLQMG